MLHLNDTNTFVVDIHDDKRTKKKYSFDSGFLEIQCGKLAIKTLNLSKNNSNSEILKHLNKKFEPQTNSKYSKIKTSVQNNAISCIENKCMHASQVTSKKREKINLKK